MDLRAEISEFLRSRRARIRPEEVGLGGGGSRRVPGLRREEVAVLAAISVDWYVRIERGNLSGVSDDVLEALADALRLDDAETTHLRDLARAARGSSRRRPTRRARTGISDGLQTVLDSMQGVAAWVRNDRFEILGTNLLARGLYDEVLRSTLARGSTARFTFLDPASRIFYTDWETAADDVVAVLRGYAGANPEDGRLAGLIGELATRSTEFSRRWAAHDVKYHRTGRKGIHHGVVGDLDLAFEALAVPDEPTQFLFVHYAADEPTGERLRLLESWAATELVDAASGRG